VFEKNSQHWKPHFLTKKTSFCTTNLRSNRLEWRVTCLEAVVKISTRCWVTELEIEKWRQTIHLSLLPFFLLCSLFSLFSNSNMLLHWQISFYSKRHHFTLLINFVAVLLSHGARPHRPKLIKRGEDCLFE